MFQELATHNSGLARHRLDRVYTSQHVCDQLDSKLGCAALEWVPKLSDHRAVVFFRSRSNATPKDVSHLSEAAIKQEDWGLRVSLAFHDLIASADGSCDPFRRLFFFKQAIREVTETIAQEQVVKQPRADTMETDDKVGWAMRLLRAAEKGRARIILRCTQAYPYLGQLVNPYDLKIRSNGTLDKMRDHALSLTRAAILEELRDIQVNEGRGGAYSQDTRRNLANARLRKLKPGSC